MKCPRKAEESRTVMFQLCNTGIPIVAEVQCDSILNPCVIADASIRATASGHKPSLRIGSRARGSLRGVALSGAQQSRRDTKWGLAARRGSSFSTLEALREKA